METITLNDGTIVNGHCIETDTALFVYLDNMPLVNGVVLFSDPEKTDTLIAVNHGVQAVYENYTVLYAASSEYGNCNLVMKRP